MSQEVETLPSVEGDLLHIRYVPLSSALLWDRNPKKHDIQKLVESIEIHGFRDPPAYDARLGAFVEGNGRTEALQWMAAQGRERPRGIGIEVQSGEWALPVLFGVDAESRLAAERYGIDHNNLTLAGGDFTTFDYARLWDGSYIDILREMAEQGEFTVSVDGDDLDALIAAALNDGETPGSDDGDENTATPRASLAERFGVPPFSVLDARQGYWQARKRAWIGLGIQSELGRGETILYEAEQITAPGLNYYRNLNRARMANDGMAENDGELRIDAYRRSAASFGAIPGGGVGDGGANSVYTGASRWAGSRGGKHATAAPGGALRPAAPRRPDGKTQRSDGRGRGLARTNGQDLMRGEGTNVLPGRKRNSRYEADMRSNVNGAPTLPEWAHQTGTANMASGTSIFDPVLCELIYRWFCPEDGAILDPFAGGSVRGVVASLLGRQYTGIDLRPEQIAANEEQARTILAPSGLSCADVTDPTALTPVEQRGSVWVKRDDAFMINGVRGGKVRTCLALAQNQVGLVTAGSRASPQVNIVAHVAQLLGIPCRVHTPAGALSPEVQSAQAAGAEVVQHPAGYNTVIIARAREDADALGWANIPFGMECAEAISQTRRQAANIPADAERIVMPAGSGMSLAGVLWGLRDAGRAIPILAVVVGADPTERLDEYAPPNWREHVTLQPSGSDYHEPAPSNVWMGITLDPHYEAKCIPFLAPGDCLWIVGVRQTAEAATTIATAAQHPAPRWIVGDSRDVATLAPGAYDLIFSCPPYADLEVYSDDPRDLSTLDYSDFLTAYRQIIASSVAMLNEDRFAVFVVGDVRDTRGFYRNFVSDTIAAFQDAGALLYNEAILVTAVGSLPIRIGKQFGSYRKLGKTHQNVLVFYKGNPKHIQEFGPVETGLDFESALALAEQGGDGD